MISFRAANRGWGHNVSLRSRDGTSSGGMADSADDPAADEAEVAATRDVAALDHVSAERYDAVGGGSSGSGAQNEEIDAPDSPWLVHPIGLVAGALIVVALLYSTVLETSFLIGNLEAWMWIGLVVTVAFSFWAVGLNGFRLGIESIASVTKRIAMFLAWFVFIVQFFNVVTRYGTRYVEQDILIGQATSLAWQSFAALFLLGANYGIRDGVNPRIDFWWANFSDKRKAWIDFVLHVTLFLPFVFMAIRILQPNAALALGRKRDGTWPSGYRVWETWEQSPDADQLPVGYIKALLLVGFVLIGIQVIAELIKTGFVIANRPDFGSLRKHDAPQKIE